MQNKLAFVLGGGGSRGAMQVGALRALHEAGIHPDLLVGTSIGAANAVFLSIHGYTLDGLGKLEQIWRSTVLQDLLPTHFWWQLMRSLFQRSGGLSQSKIREFAIANGITPEMRFCDIQGAALFLVAADMNARQPVIFGQDPQDFILDSLLASMALPPWVAPQQAEGRYLVDGGFISNLPIQAALLQGATQIIALDLFEPNDVDTSAHGLRPFIWRLDKTVEYRQEQLELELAKARGVPVHLISLVSEAPVPIWDFHNSIELIEHGYQLTRQAMAEWDSFLEPWQRKSGIWQKLFGLTKK